MPKPLRQTIEIPVAGETYAVDVTFRIIEIVERVYERRADIVGIMLQNELEILRSDVAKVIAEWLKAARIDHDRDEVYQAVLTAPAPDLRVYVGCIAGAIYYSLKEIDADELKKAARGESLEPEKKSETSPSA